MLNSVIFVAMMRDEMKIIPAGQFKAQCLALLDDVARSCEPIVVTKHGNPVAQVVPYAGPQGQENPLKTALFSRTISCRH